MTFFAIFLAGVAALAGLVLGCSGAGAASSPGAPASGPSTSSASPASTAPARPEPLSPTTGKHIKLLAVGNSFSANATRYLPDIVRVSGNVLTFGHAAVGGCSLEQHWSYVEAFEKNPDDPKGRDGM